jgi:protein translocase SecG subunit
MKNFNNILTIVNMVVMVALIIMISMQNKSAGLSNVFGGGGSIVQTRRGVEKWLFYATIVGAVIFVGLSIANVLLRK